MNNERARMYVVIVGHVDHGKSTIIGRLLADTGSLPEGRLEQVKALCQRTDKPFEYAFLLDALKDERAQGITIDAARVFFSSAQRDYVILDAPGHSEFLKNMITGAARAEAALLVIDAAEGVKENSRRHGTMLSLLGIDKVTVVVNKMDLVGWKKETFDAVVAEYAAFLGRLGVSAAAFVPASGRGGDNLATRSEHTPWYDGPTILEALDRFAPRAAPIDGPLRLPVQDIYKFTSGGDDRRIIAGTIVSGRVAMGDEVVFLPSGKKSRIASIEEFNAPTPDSAHAGKATGVTLTEQIYVARGEILTRATDSPPHVGTRLSASVFWLGRAPLVRERDYLLKLGTARHKVRVEAIRGVMDASTLGSSEREQVERHEVADVVLSLARPLAFDLATEVAETSRFVLIDDYEIRGGGIIRQALEDEGRKGGGRAESGAVVWLTGLSGSGKTTIARAVAEELERQGKRVEFFDGDALREIMPAGFTKEERDAHVKRVGFFASRLSRHGVIVVAALVSPYRESRDWVRAVTGRFCEVYVSTPLAECERRDVKGLYAKARRGEIRAFTGIDDPYEAPSSPELVIDTTKTSLDEAVTRILESLHM